MSPELPGSDHKGKVCEQGLGKAHGRGEAVFQKSPLSAQALFFLLSKSLAFLEIKVSAAEELVRPVRALRNQARAKLEGTDAMGTCSPA